MFQQEYDAYNLFLSTGKVDDYLTYCKAKQPQMQAESGKAVKQDAAHAGGHHPPHLQNRNS